MNAADRIAAAAGLVRVESARREAATESLRREVRLGRAAGLSEQELAELSGFDRLEVRIILGEAT